MQYALSKNVVVIAAAGNCGAESGTSRCPTQNATDYPAAYAGVLAVGATDHNDQPTAFSTAGTHIGISAPGTAILSTFPTYRVQLNGEGIPPSPYAVLRGTSQAAPIVAGVAALLVSREPSLPPSEVTQRLRSSADDVATPGYDTKTGDGRVNAVRALAAQTVLRYGATYQVQSPPSTLANATSATLKVSIANRSSFTWPARGSNAVRVATHWYTAAGALVVWDGPRAGLAADVPAGASVILEVPLSVPVPKGSYVLKVDLVQEGVTWFSARDVPPLTLTVLVNAGYGATYQPAQSSLSLATGSATSLAVTLMNTGSRTWPAAGAEPVRLASHLRDASGGAVVLWDGPRAPLAADLAPGATATVTLPVPVPLRTGVFALELDLVHEGVLWFSNEGVLTSPAALFISSGGTRLYGARYSLASPSALLPGARLRVVATVTNTGALTWAAGGATPVRLATHVLDARGALVQWEGPRTSLSAEVPPGATAALSLAIDAPRLPGTYRVRPDLVREGVSWFSSQGVEPPELALVVAVDRRASVAFNVASVSRSAPQPIVVTVKNASGVAYSSEGAQPVLVSSHWLGADGRVLLWDGPRAALPRALRPAEEASLALPIASPPAGAVVLAVDLLQEGLAWFGTERRQTVAIVP